MSAAGIKRIAGVLAALLMPMPAVLLFFHGNWYSFFHSYSLAMFCGILSYGYFCVTLTLAGRLRWCDRLYGHDRVLVFHGGLACIALLLALLHWIFKRLYFPETNLQVALGISGLFLFGLVILMTVVFMIKTPLNRFCLTAGILNKTVQRFPIDYTVLKLLHNLSTVALLVILIHVFLALPVQESLVRTLLMGTTGGIALLVFIYHKCIRPAVCYIRAWRVCTVRRLSPTITEIEMAPCGNSRVSHKAGQFCYFRFLSSACGKAEHSFTISSAPGSINRFITVKDLGNYSAKLAHLEIGTKALIDGPYGLFTPRPSSIPLLFLAGGIGITPFLSILRDYQKNHPGRKIQLIWSVHKPEELIASEELLAIQQTCDFLEVAIKVTGGLNPVTGKQDGRVDAPFLESRLKKLGEDEATVYLCGPESFRLECIQNLHSLGIRSSRIHFEKFSF